MGSKSSEWLRHLLAAEASGGTLVAYAKQHGISVQRLYNAKWARVKSATSDPGKSRSKAFARVKVVPAFDRKPAAAALAIQARLANGVVLSWQHDSHDTQALGTVLAGLAALPCFI